jgi:hypothetical protein
VLQSRIFRPTLLHDLRDPRSRVALTDPYVRYVATSPSGALVMRSAVAQVVRNLRISVSSAQKGAGVYMRLPYPLLADPRLSHVGSSTTSIAVAASRRGEVLSPRAAEPCC